MTVSRDARAAAAVVRVNGWYTYSRSGFHFQDRCGLCFSWIPRMEPLLGVKIGCLFALLVLTLVCGLIPICFKWFQIDAATGRHRRVLSLLGCASAGVFLGAGLMHMTAEALEGIDSEIQKFKMQNRTEKEGNASDDAGSAQHEVMGYILPTAPRTCDNGSVSAQSTCLVPGPAVSPAHTPPGPPNPAR
ncbi:zinc transporter ZIP2 isoform X5 [Ursus maritimus]|nr:zinc transporter ZIP2 isoform X5 [Ursus maritimus]